MCATTTMPFDHRREAGRQKMQRVSTTGSGTSSGTSGYGSHQRSLRRIAAYGAFDFVESSYRGEVGTWWRAVRDAWAERDTVRAARTPLPRDVLRRAELNRGRMHLRLLFFQLAKKLRLACERRRPAILVNTWYRVIADLLAKLASIALYIAIARELGSEEFGVFAFGLSFVSLVTALADFGQDRVLTREVARSHRAVDRYFVNTVGLKLVLAVPALAVALWILTRSRTRRHETSPPCSVSPSSSSS